MTIAEYIKHNAGLADESFRLLAPGTVRSLADLGDSVLVFYLPQSAQALLSLRKLGHAIAQVGVHIRLDIAESAYFMEALECNLPCKLNGYGETFWIVGGEISHYLARPYATAVEDIAKLMSDWLRKIGC